MESVNHEKTEYDNLSKLRDCLQSIKNNKLYIEDKDVIEQTYILVSKLFKNDINNEILDLINQNIDFLYEKYEELDYLVNLYVSVYSYFKGIVHKRYVDNLRKINREKRKNNEKNE